MRGSLRKSGLFLSALTAFASASAHAFTAPSIWIHPLHGSPRIIDPERSGGSTAAHGVTDPLPDRLEIKAPFLLNSEGKRYEAGKGQKPFAVSGKGALAGIYLGFELTDAHGARRLAIHVDDIALQPPALAASVARTPVPPRLSGGSEDSVPACRAPDASAVGTLAATSGVGEIRRALGEARIDPATESSDVLAAQSLVRQFHEEDCERGRLANPRDSSMAQEITALSREWDRFLGRRLAANPALAKRLTMARQLDMVARTMVFEAHPPGELERDAGAAGDCSDPSGCPLTSCEARIIALSIRNRGRSPACREHFGCRAPGDFIGVATAPDQFNIWSPASAHRYLATCFLRDGIDTLASSRAPAATLTPVPGAVTDLAAYAARARQFRVALEIAGRVLFGSEPGWGIRNALSATPLARFTHYYHPGGMRSCDPLTYDHRYHVHAAYLRIADDAPDYDLAFERTVYVPGGRPGAEVRALFQRTLGKPERAAAAARGLANDGYDFAAYRAEGDAGERDWRLPGAALRKLPVTHACLPMGLALLGRDPRACDGKVRAQYREAPHWGFEHGAESMQFSCTSERGPPVTLGGPCDARMQTIGKVP